MKKYFLLIIFFTLFFSASAQYIWTTGTAQTLQKRQWEKGIFQPLRYGITEKFEISTYPLANVAVPNLSFKKLWHKDRNAWMSTRHAVHYPGILLPNLAKYEVTFPEFLNNKSGKDTLVQKNQKIPFMLGITNEVLYSTFLKKESACKKANYLLTGKLGVQFAYKKENITVPSIEYPKVFQRTSIYNDKILWYLGVDLDADLNRRLGYCFDLDFYSIGINVEDFAVEHKGLLIWRLDYKHRLVVGYQVHYGTYPSGNDFRLIPLVDFMWIVKRKARKTPGDI